MLHSGSRFYFTKLSDGEKNLYDHIAETLDRFDPALSIHAGMGKPFTVDIQKILTYVLLDNPAYFYLDKDRIVVKQTPMHIQLCFQYGCTQTEAEKLSDRIKEKIAEFMREYTTPKMTPLARQLAVHKYLQSAVKPDHQNIDPDSYSIVGALLRCSCVCEGFAKAYKLLCDYLGVASIVVSGEALRDGKREAHAWNISRINGVTAHTDMTWDTIVGIGSYDYFNLCDADMAADHSFDTVLYPKCAPNKINYFYKNNLIASNAKEAEKIIAKNMDKDFFSIKLLFPVTQEWLAGFGFAPDKLRFNDTQNVVMFTK
jgi:transglutaminase/protease-like cytokinesis protein 3